MTGVRPITLAQIMEDHGLQRELVELFMPPLMQFAEQDSEEALMLIRDLMPHSATIAREAGPGWVGDDNERWSALVDSLFGDHDLLGKCWEWMPELMPEATPRQRWDTLFCLLKREPDPDHLLDRYMSQAWVLYDKARGPRRAEILQHIYALSYFTQEWDHAVRAWDLLLPMKRNELPWRKHRQITMLVAAERWEDAAGIILDHISDSPLYQRADLIGLRALAAAALRNEGKIDLAAEQDELVEKLVLGDPVAAREVAGNYAHGGDHERACIWYERELRFAIISSDEFLRAASNRIDMDKSTGDTRWQQRAVLAEVFCASLTTNGMDGDQTHVSARSRMLADLYQAISLWPDAPDRARSMLDSVYARHVSSPFLADFFFPAVIKAKIEGANQRWFIPAWQKMTDRIEKYTESVVFRRHAANLAASAGMHLVEAEAMLLPAIQKNTKDPESLIAMARLKLAMGNQEEVLEWTQKALHEILFDDHLRQRVMRIRREATESF